VIPPVSGSQYRFAAIKRFSQFIGRTAFDTPEPENSIEGIFREPIFALLAAETAQDGVYLHLCLRMRSAVHKNWAVQYLHRI
jgi:hypothetical protein